MTVWNPVFIRTVPSHPYPSLKVDFSFKSMVLAFRTNCSKAQPSWRRAGRIYPIIQLPGIEEPFQGVGQRLNLGTQILRFDNLTLPFELDFYPVGWLSDVSMIIWEPDPPILDLNLEIDFGSTSQAD